MADFELDMEVDKVAVMMADMEMNKVADMAADMFQTKCKKPEMF